MHSYLRVAILAFLILVAFATTARFFRVAYYHLKAPHDICFESHNLASIKSIQAGANIYDKGFYGDWPFIITIYNPLFHYIVASLPQSNSNPFFVGRLISLISTILIAMLLFLPSDIKGNLKYAIIFLISFFLMRLTVRYAAYLRSDTLGVFFSGAAIVLLDRVYPKKVLLAAVAFLCFLAFLSKQSFIAASVTCCLFLIMKDKGAGIFFATILASIYTIFAVFATVYWGEGYWFSAYVAVIKTPASALLTLSHWKHMLGDPILVLLCIVTLFSISYAIHRNQFQFLRDSPYPLYLLFSFLSCAFSGAKLGSSENGFLEVVLALLLWNVYFTGRWVKEIRKGLLTNAILILFLFLAAMELVFANPNAYSFADAKTIAFRENAYSITKREIEQLNPPNDHFVSLNCLVTLYKVQSGAYLNDPFNYWMMWTHGILDVAPFVKAIQMERFSLILIVDAEKNPYGIPSMPSFPPGSAFDRIGHAISEHYSMRKRGVFIYLAPLNKRHF